MQLGLQSGRLTAKILHEQTLDEDIQTPDIEEPCQRDDEAKRKLKEIRRKQQVPGPNRPESLQSLCLSWRNRRNRRRFRQERPPKSSEIAGSES